MRKLLILFLFIPSVIYSQTFPNPFRYNTKVLVNSQYIDNWFGANDAKIYTNKDTFRFNKPIDLTTGNFTVNGKPMSADSSIFSTHYYTNRQITYATTGLLDYRGTYDASLAVFPSTGGSGTGGTILKGDWWSVTTEGTIGGILFTDNSKMYAKIDAPGQTAANWDYVIQTQPAVARAAEDVGNGYIDYTATNLVNGKFFGGYGTITGSKILGYNGLFYSRLYGVSNSYGNAGEFVSANTYYALRLSSSNQTTLRIDRANSGNALEIANVGGGAIKASFDYTGKLTCNGADFGNGGIKITNSSSSGNGCYIINSSNGNGSYIYNISTGKGNYVENTSTGYGNYTSNSYTGIGNYIYNSSTGYGMIISNINDGYGASISNTSTGYGIAISNLSTGIPLMLNLSSNGINCNKNYLLKYKSVDNFYADSTGDIHNTPPHAASTFFDSSRVITLTQNNWVAITNSWKNLFPAGEFTKITKTGDSIKIQKNGHYLMTYEVNASGTANATYEYRIQKRHGSTITTLNKYQMTGTGSVVLRTVHWYCEGVAGDVFWVEIRTTTSGNNSITVLGGNLIVTTIHLDL